MALTAQIGEGREGRGGAAAPNIEVVKLQVFNRTSSKLSGFVMACKIYIKNRMREVAVEEQILWVLSYV